MKTRVFNIFGFVVFATILAMTSCRDQDFDFEEHYTKNELQKEFTNNWLQEVGPIDPEQDWNVLSNYSINVNVKEKSEVRVYAKRNGQFSIVADYHDISGSKTITFDSYKGTEELMVSDGNVIKPSVVGGTIDFCAGTRGVIESGTGSSITVKKSDYYVYESDLLNSIFNYLPKGERNRTKPTSKHDFTLTSSTNKIVVYPIFTKAPIGSTVGIYYYSNSVKIEKDIFTVANNDDALGHYVETEILSVHDTRLDKKEVKTKEDAQAILGDEVKIEDFTPATFNSKGGVKTNASYTYKEQVNEYRPYTNNLNWDNYSMFQTKGIEIEFPNEDTVFGFYIKSDGDKHYTEKKYNPKFWFLSTIPWGNDLLSGTFNINNQTFVGLEDTHSNFWDPTDYDLCDFVLMVENVETLAEDEPTYIIACEDLGDTGDIDFNDLVLEISCLSGSGELYIRPLAAGGTLSATYGFGTTSLGEIHSKFGEGQYSTSTMINTNAREGFDGIVALPEKIDVDKEFSLANNIKGKMNMGGFWIKVGDEQASAAVLIEAPQKGGNKTAPQMLLLPGNWVWPKEREPIVTAYPNFSDWSNSCDAEWISNTTKDVLYSAPRQQEIGE